LVISDIHVPYHSIDAINAAIQFGLDNKINGLILNGDLIDFAKISRFHADPYKQPTISEMNAGRDLLKILTNCFPKTKKLFIEGNHDVRWDFWLKQNAVHIYDDPNLRFRALMGFDALGWDYLDETGYASVSGLRILHGHTVTRSMIPAVNAARGLFLKVKQSALIGHTHKISEHTETTMDGKIITCWSAGCLCELNPDYNPIGNNYSHGFSHIKIFNDKEYSVKNYRIFNGKIL
jgi:predicted phosphodiesterase